MAVTLVSTPDLFALTQGKRTQYEFAGSGPFQTTGVKATCVLFVSPVVSNPTTITLHWNGRNHKLVFNSAPSAPNEFLSGAGDSEYVDALLEQLKGFYPLREDFVMTRYDPTQLPGIVFTAKKAGKNYDLSIVNQPVGSPFTIGTTLFGAEPLLRIQYSIYVEVWLQQPGTDGTDLDGHYSRIFDFPVETNLNGDASFDVGNILHSALKADLPTWNLPAPTSGLLSQRKYYLAYGEAFGSPLEIGRLHRDEVRHAYLGGADYVAAAGGGFGFLDLRNSTASDDAALRFGSLTRFVRPDEPQYLTFLNSRDDQEGVLLKIIRTFDNDATDTIIDNLAAQDWPTGAKLTYCVGPTQQDLLNTVPDNRTLKEYSVQLVSSAQAPLSLVYRYILNYDYQPYTRYFVYLSSLGVLDTLVTFGKGSLELARFSEQAQTNLPTDYELADGQYVDYNVASQKKFEVTTGWRSPDELLLWDDFYRSPLRFHLRDGKPLPIGITSQSIKQAKDADTLFAHLFQFIYLFRDAFFTASTGEVGDTLPPLGFTPAGSVTIEHPQLINSVDATVPNIVRTLTTGDINSFKAAAARPNPETLGYMNETTGSAVFRRLDQGVPYSVLTGKPTTRDQAGLSDVPTISDLFNISRITPHVLTWSGADIPTDLN